MLHAVFITNKQGNVLLERFRGFTADECSQWRSFLGKLGQKDLESAPNEEQFIATYRSTYVVYTRTNDVFMYLLGADEYDELGLSAILSFIIDLLKELCKNRSPTQAAILDRYGRICLCLDEVMGQGILEHMDKDRIRKLTRLRPIEAGK